ncbi:MAG TPA: branched-chain amino acid aminotransferase [Clostridia bacterium]|nr:branched-chain amino acid aminotransferase [Clostridia bacterium]
MGKIKFIKKDELKVKPKDSELVFGTQFTDYMFVMDYDVKKGWYDPRIVPYGPIEMSPSSMVFHYGQAIFEGMKAYRDNNGDIVTFRAMDNFNRMNRSADRICMPKVDTGFVWDALNTLLDIERDWVPSSKDTSLYIRPFMIATDPFLGVRPSNTYKFFIILSPVGPYYPEGLDPVKIYVEDKYVRVSKGGTGEAKVAGNYAASLLAAEKAKDKGYSQVLWLDAADHTFVEEVGAMNIFFKIDGKLITAPLDGSILPGITRDSVIKLAKHLGYTVEERDLRVEDVFAAHDNGTLEEVFGSGTAAVISPVGILEWMDNKIEINDGKIGEFTSRMYDMLTGIQYGTQEDVFGWVNRVKCR